jgi:hypothetical protein
MKLCNHSIQILFIWTLSITLFLFKILSCFYSKHNVLETEFCLHLQVKPIKLGQIDRASPYHCTVPKLLIRKDITYCF